ncbi:SRPBCC domain-containing protein [Streptomyces corynorhini]|uniref:SRPBCC domain-containing protein n=1 Tax=Streptomyces corynorhini TaxID=2282652 RepID=UPI0026814676|nr:SRPBCC domain-containing protein [Streptomyces corynorhini]
MYRALGDPEAIARWRVPAGMTCHVHAFDVREGGAFRVPLLSDVPLGTGRSASGGDTYLGRVVRLLPDERVVEELEFETADPAPLVEACGRRLGG